MHVAYVGTCDTLLRVYMLVAVAVVVAFVMCWAPFHAQRLLTIYIREDQWTDALLETQSVLFYTSGMTITQQSTVIHVYFAFPLRYFVNLATLATSRIRLDRIEQGLTSHSTHFRSFRRRWGDCGISQDCSRNQSPQCVRC